MTKEKAEALAVIIQRMIDSRVRAETYDFLNIKVLCKSHFELHEKDQEDLINFLVDEL